MKKCADDDSADDEYAESWPLSGEKQRPSSGGLVTVVTVKTPNIEKNYRTEFDDHVELQPLSAGAEINNAKSQSYGGKGKKKKKIPIVENLRTKNEDDGTEV